MTVRSAFLAVAVDARALIADPEVARQWHEPSALREMTTGHLAGHLARGVFTVEQYLGAPAPTGTATVTPGAYFVEGAKLTDDMHDELNTQIRQRSRAESQGGHGDLVMRLDQSIGRVTAALSEEEHDRLVAVFGGTLMTLDDYLVARLVELVIHIDDLAVSVAVETPSVVEEARALVVDCLVEMARRAHGDLAVIRAMARRERGSPDALHVF